MVIVNVSVFVIVYTRYETTRWIYPVLSTKASVSFYTK